jgi:hypothetical protein
MRSGGHVQLAALRNRDIELQTTSPFSNHGSVERSTVCYRHKNVLHVWIYSIFVGFFKSSHFFCVTLYLLTVSAVSWN